MSCPVRKQISDQVHPVKTLTRPCICTVLEELRSVDVKLKLIWAFAYHIYPMYFSFYNSNNKNIPNPRQRYNVTIPN